MKERDEASLREAGRRISCLTRKKNSIESGDVKAIYKWGILAAVGAGGVWAYVAYNGGESPERSFATDEVICTTFLDKVQATGTLEPQELVDVGAQVTGEIKEFGVDANGKRVDYGSEVKEGQLLARIDDTIVELDIQKAEAQVAQSKAGIAQAKATILQAQANKNKADRDLKRAEKLGVGEALSQMSFDQYKTEAETSAANLAAAEAQLQTAEAQLQSAEASQKSQLRNRDYTHIKSPVDGTIVVRQVNVGQTVVSSMNATTLFLVARDLTKMQIWASVNEADIAKIRPGQEVRYTVDALPNEEFTGKVNKIRPNATMTSNVVTYVVEVDIDNPDRKLLPYMSANANFVVQEQKDVLMVTEAAFTFTPEQDMIAPEYRDKAAHKRPGPPKEGAELPEPPQGEPAVIWRLVDDKHVAPVRVLKGSGDGARSIITPAPGETGLTAGTRVVTGINVVQAAVGGTKSASSDNPFMPKRPQRAQRGTGGAPAKPGQSQKNSHPGPPM